jgi:chromosome segregation ATPase
MTTGSSEEISAGRRTAGPETSPDVAQPTEHAPQDAGPHAEAQSGPPDGLQELKAEIEQTREQLGQTVEQLAAKADVKSQARAKMAALTGQAKSKAAQARTQAAGRSAGARSQVAGKAVLVRQKTAGVSGTAKTQVQAWAAPVWQATPEPLQRAATKSARTARQRPELLAAAGALLAGLLAVRWWRRR